MHFDDLRVSVAAPYAAAIRAAYAERLKDREARLLEPMVRSLAREARASGMTAERAIVALKLSVLGELPYAIARLATDEDQRKYALFERLIGCILDEYFEPALRDGLERAS